MSGSMPVVSQSIMNAMVPVGARTVVWALRNPNLLPRSTASSHALRAEADISSSSSFWSSFSTAALCIRITLSIGSWFFSK